MHTARWRKIPFDFSKKVASLAENRGKSLELTHNMIQAQKSAFPNLKVDWERIVECSTKPWIMVGISERLSTANLLDHHRLEMEER